MDQLEKKSTGVAVVLSILFTGAGHLYAGKEEKGGILLIIYVVLAILAAATSGIGLLFLIPFWIWGIIDSSNAVDEYNAEQTRKETRKRQDEQKAQEERKAKETAAREAKEKETISAENFVSQLGKLSKLHTTGFLTDEEYGSRKKDLILSLLDKQLPGSPEDFFTTLIPSVEKGHLNKEEVTQIKELLL